MGSASMIGLGLALAQPKRRVLVITGDGEMLMGLGSLATIGAQHPGNLTIVVLDNERYGETGMQKTHTGYGVDLASVAKACGFAEARIVRRNADLGPMYSRVYHARGPLFFQVKIAAEALPLVLPPRDGNVLRQRFRETLLGKNVADP
jgi:thiamine pyrophosphate-dependent acetolactate synthase large subunit-like protein